VGDNGIGKVRITVHRPASGRAGGPFCTWHYRASAAAVVARNGFTRVAIQAAATSGVHLFRPGDVVRGSPFDRTLQQQATYVAQENDRKSEIWSQYDAATLRYSTIVRNRSRWSQAICVSGTPCLLETISTPGEGFELQRCWAELPAGLRILRCMADLASVATRGAGICPKRFDYNMLDLSARVKNRFRKGRGGSMP
jgi:hypothetical protein